MMHLKESSVGKFNILFFAGALALEAAMLGFTPGTFAERSKPVVKTEIQNADKGISFRSQGMIAPNFHQVNTGIRGHERFF